jgi:hypothetical protein
MLTEDIITELRQRGPQPQLADSEVVAMLALAEMSGINADRHAHAYFKSHWRRLFPRIGDRTAFVRQAASLWKVMDMIRKRLLGLLLLSGISVVDGIPMLVCGFTRANFSKVFKGAAAFGYCAAKDEKYYGFKGHLVTDSKGIVCDFTLTPANADEREALFDMLLSLKPLTLGDKEYICSGVSLEEIQSCGTSLETPKRSNMEASRPKGFLRWMMSTRRIIETVIGQLAERFNIEKIRARDVFHLTGRLNRKLLAHTICCLMNFKRSNPTLQFALLFEQWKNSHIT